MATPSGDICVVRFTTYWRTMARHVVRNDLDKRMVQLHLFPSGQIPDGLLFRVSSIDRDAVRAFKVQQRFDADMMSAVLPTLGQRMSGLKSAGATLAARCI